MILKQTVLKIYQDIAYVRCDDDKTAYYFSVNDFPNLHKNEYIFNSSKGHKLHGNFYYYPNPIAKRVIIFDHGFGGGHLSYMKEIEKLCSFGFLVFSYDHTGCMNSGGENTYGMAQSLCDLNDALTELKRIDKLNGYDFSVVGHSWGGYSTLNICSLHPEISHIVVISGFVSVKELINSYFPGILKIYRKYILELEEKNNSNFVKYDARESLKNSNAAILLIYSENDKLCKKYHYDILHSALNEKQNVKFILEKNKGHNPNYTVEAVSYLQKYIKEKNRLKRKNKLQTTKDKSDFIKSFDWDKMTKQDEKIWSEIYKSLK